MSYFYIMAMNLRKGFRFTTYEVPEQTPFEKLFEIFQELVTHTSGDVEEAVDRMLPVLGARLSEAGRGARRLLRLRRLLLLSISWSR